MARFGAKVKTVDHYARRMKRESAKPQPKLKVGVTEKTARRPHPKSGKPIGDIAFFNEYGTVTTPSRSFIRDFVDERLEDISRQLATDRLRTLKVPTEDMKSALGKRGKQYVREIVRRINARIPPPNAPSTLAQKVGDTPLIDTETLIDAIVSEVKD